MACRCPGEGTVSGERVERRLTTILASDIAGYSRLIGLDEEGTIARLRSLRREVIDPAIAAYRGRIVKTREAAHSFSPPRSRAAGWKRYLPITN
jgi:class 3 adenylate cyclase